MKKLINLFTKPKSNNLKEFLNTEIKDDLIEINLPNVGSYKSGSRTLLIK